MYEKIISTKNLNSKFFYKKNLNEIPGDFRIFSDSERWK